MTHGWATYAAALADKLVRDGAIVDPAWRKAFAGTPRHQFVPRFFLLDQFNQPRHVFDGTVSAHRERWLELAYRDEAVVTAYEVIGTMPDGEEIRVATNSASAPHVVAVMLDRLKLTQPPSGPMSHRPAHRVLEVGTGTGYTAALLCAHLGDRQVTSVEVNPGTAADASQNLAATGHQPTLAVGDGRLGYAPNAPYDRILATCALDHIPPGWVEQLADDGMIVAPLTYGGGPLAVLHKTGPGQLSGRLDNEEAHFMPMRGTSAPLQVAHIPDMTGAVRTRNTGVPPSVWSDEQWLLWLSVHSPLSIARQYDTNGDWCGIAVYTPQHRSGVVYTGAFSTTRWPVTEGENGLWDEVETAWETWKRHGWPGRSRISLTVSGGMLRFTLDHQPLPIHPAAQSTHRRP